MNRFRKLGLIEYSRSNQGNKALLPNVILHDNLPGDESTAIRGLRNTPRAAA